jgi:uroporphyrinogen-III synthase
VAAAVTLIVTRPGAAGRRLAEDLCSDGQPALWLPAFEFGGAPDEAAARRTLADLARFDLAIFVSPQSARATAELLATPWLPATAIAAVGAGTRAAVLASIAGAAAATLITPASDDGGSGSEALWPMLRALPVPPCRVLLLRAQCGRDWLGERLQESGAEVVPLAVYSRQAYAPPEALRAQLTEAARGAMASLFTSSDAIDALDAMLGSQPAVLRRLRAGLALASHPRIVDRLRAAGFARIAECRADVAAVRAALRGAGG